MRTRTRALGVGAALIIAAACGGGGSKDSAGSSYPTTPTTPSVPTVPANTMIATKDLTFNPASITVARNATVSFVVEDSIHDIYFLGNGAPAALPITSNQTIQRTFTTAGSFNVYCRRHSYMTGLITVQ